MADLDDQCDLDELTAFLEQDSDLESNSDDTSLDQACNTPQNIEAGSVSSEQLNEEEIAALFDAEYSDTEAPDNKPKDKDEKQSNPESENKMVLKTTNEDKEGMHYKSQSQIAEELASEKERLAHLEELLKAKERIAQLEAALKSSPATVKSTVGPGKVREVEKNPFFSDEIITKPKKGKGDSHTSRPSSSTPTMDTSSVASMVTKEDNQSEDFFPADSDSDWEGMDDEEKSKLNESGKEIKQLIQSGPKQRQAHTSFYSQTQKTTWKNKPTNPADKPKISSKSSKPDDNCKVDPFSGIRIINPLVSSLEMKTKMADRKMIKLSRLESRVGTRDLENEWVTIGVIVSKSETRTSSNGKSYMIWKLSDLDDCDQIVSLFLFGDVYKHLWKTEKGKVIAILNASIMQQAEKKSFSNREVSITVDNYMKILPIGISKDLGKCAAKTKSGSDCTSFINKNTGEYCTFHLQAAYKKHSARRAELQTTFSGPQPKAYEKKCFGGGRNGNTVVYQGQTVSSARVSLQKKKDKVSLKHLQSHQAKNNKVSAVSLVQYPLKPGDEEKLRESAKLKELSESQKNMAELLSKPTPGAMQLVKHLAKMEQVKDIETAKKNNKPIVSIKPKDLLKQHHQQLSELKKANKPVKSSSSQSIPSGPMLGRGLVPGADVFFDDIPLSKAKVKANRAKAKAIAAVQSKGGLLKTNPNEVRKKLTQEEKETKRKRYAEEMEKASQEAEEDTNQPPRKRSRWLGDLDPDSEEFKRLMSIRSRFAGINSDAELERQEKYFAELEKKEKMEEKMSSITTQKCTAVTCKDCKYTAFSANEKCKQEKHNLKYHSSSKRWFKCANCKHRTVTLCRYPPKTCVCGSYKWEKDSMYKERKGPVLESEQLLLRGREEKFLNSLQ